MTTSEKPKRSYNSARRVSQASETRRQIIEAARRLFTQRGYSGATIEAIAHEADVAPETVFAIFKNKRNILATLIDISVGGDEQPIPLLERPGPQAVLSEQDPVRQLRLFAQDISVILERVAPVFEVMRAAAKTEPDIAALLRDLLQQRLNTMRRFVENLSGHASLRAGMTVDQAADMVWAISSPELFSLLVVDRGWSRERYSQWLGDALARLLILEL